MAVQIIRNKRTIPPVQTAAVQPSEHKPTAGEYIQRIMETDKQNGALDALVLAQQALADYPTNYALLNNTAVMMMRSSRYQDAIEVFQRIPDYENNAVVLANIGTVYHRLKQYPQAVDYLNRSLAIQPKGVAALLTLGSVYVDKQDYPQALAVYEKILTIQPNDTATMFNIATVYGKLQQPQQSALWHKRVLNHDPTYIDSLGNWAMTQCYNSPYDAAKIARDTMHYASRCVQESRIVLPPIKVTNPANAEKKLRIGLVTADLRDMHPVGRFLRGLLLSEAVKQFDWSLYLNTNMNDNLAKQVRPLFSHWHRIDAWTDAKVRDQIRADGVDILIDLSGYTGKNRVGVFFAQTAPIQLEWLGYFATTGLPDMNGIIADPYCVPMGEEHLYSETVYRLPHTRLCMQPPVADVEVGTLPALKNGYITFGCFQNPLKISDEVLQLWVEIAQALPQARWHFKGHAIGKQKQQKFAEKLTALGFNPQYVQFSSRSPWLGYLQAHNNIDLILDTFPFPGGTTTVDALWMGVPTLTYTQPGMIARQGEQLLSAAGFPQFVCRSYAEYINKALYWAKPSQRQALATLRNTMRETVRQSPLFDTAAFADDWCKLIREIWREACR
ncbi:putative O-linked N-acetylglucosamine transferase (SPINDLY family) [Cricetibacter osteomyelitidis]|uniref:protein O-GlcNAc transferase n=1 Tax=Cricetibacter osteomyelitidis TaxID=1521931 RepID=A0A4V2T2C0_9PAST|nr:tetratricopeptide repeat protein [Cricetibacter osteomyelitidis]TCP96853.1 putative O-linked N-acetylglucosamine transferase (SPINDLY family) [Cricetibacter osteomyelitidis]